MELEYKEGRSKGRFVVVAGVILALLAGGLAFYTVNQAQQQAGQGGAKKVPLVVAVLPIPARQVIKSTDVALREVPLDATNANGTINDPKLAVGRIAAVTILEGQLVTSNLLASTTEGAPFSILAPGESITPDSAPMRAIAITVPDDLALGGALVPGQTVDVFVTAVVNVNDPSGKYVVDRSTKITYQDVVILSRTGSFYVIRATLPVAEELAHLQATGSATFSFALRPSGDDRLMDVSALGETTNRIIEKYGLPIPEAITPGGLPAASPAPAPSATPGASPVPGASLAPGASAAPSPGSSTAP
jgi:Flp pilus assembly protein CpaB